MAIDPQQQRIIGYFLEEAREHLQTIAHGLNNLAQTIASAEALHEMYRAAHSIKGGAAMLGVESVRLIAYHLEDCFKKIKEAPNLEVDQKLVDLFLEAYAYLPQLLKHLEKNYEVPQAVTEAVIAASTDTLEKLGEHLTALLSSASTKEESTSTIDPYEQFGAVVQAVLQQMAIFLSEPRTEEATESLVKLCDELLQWGEYLQVEQWNALVVLIKQVIANPFNSFAAIAPILSQDLQTACDLVVSHRASEIVPSSALQELLAPPVYSDVEDEQTSNIFSSVPMAEDDPDTEILLQNTYTVEPTADTAEPEIDWSLREIAEPEGAVSPRIGAVEMETLSNLFEQQDIDMGVAWQDMEANDIQIAMGNGEPASGELVSAPEEDISDFLESLTTGDLSSETSDLDTLLAELEGDTSDDLENILSASEARDDQDVLDSLLGDSPAKAEVAPLMQEEGANEFSALGLEEFLAQETPSLTEEGQFADEDVTYFQIEEPVPSEAQFAPEPSTDELADFFAGELETIVQDGDHTELETLGEGDDIFGELDLGLEDVYQPSSATAEEREDVSPLDNLLQEIDTAANYDSDLLAELDLNPLTDPAVAVSATTSSELDELSQFFEFGDEPVDQPAPLAVPEEVPNVPLADGNPDIPDLAALERLIGAPASMEEELAVLESLIDQPYGDNFDELKKMLAGNTPAHTNGIAIDLAPATAPAVKPDSISELETLLGSTSQPAPPTPAKPILTQPTRRSVSSTVRVDVKYLDSLNNLVGELVVNRNLLEQDQERLQNSMYILQQRVQQLGDVSQRMRDQFDRSLLESSLMVGRSRNQYFSQLAREGSGEAQSITAQFEDIEFDRYNAFHVLSQEIIELIVRIKESAADIGYLVAETEQVTRELGRIATQVQDDLKQSRMVPFANLADRLPRGVRDRAVRSGKQAELVILGRETLVDKSILEQLTDPMTHLVNNAVDHGLEPPEVRRQAGKPPQGTIEVRAFHQGNQTVITVRDDGAGINPERVKQKAVEKGLRTPEQVARMTDEEAYELLFLPGFSTRSQADEFAGRGVGLDVVRTALDEIRGSIFIQSEVGKGTQFTIRLPLTLSISKAVFCAVDTARVAIPLDGFEDMVELPQSQVILNNVGQTCIPWRDMLLPFQPLSNLLRFNRQLGRVFTKQESDEICVIVLRDSDNNYLGLQVDQFLGEHEIVVKQLEGPVPKPPGIAGATVLGDGRVISIVNVLELFDIANGRLRLHTVQQIPVEGDKPEQTQPTVLIVDDSITVRELLSMTFSKVGYHVEQAKNGKDAWERLKAGLPCDLIFCDIEMPEMDGMELLARLQKDENLRHIPMAMLTSRGADKHRQAAIQLGAKAYFTKPYLEEELLTASQRLLRGEVLV